MTEPNAPPSKPEQGHIAYIRELPERSGIWGCTRCGNTWVNGQVQTCTCRPAQPIGENDVWYRGWEVSYDGQGAYAAVFGDGRWTAYKGGCDLGAPELTASNYQAILDEVDAAEDE